MLRKGFSRGFLIGFSLLLVLTLISSSNFESLGSVKARLGGEMSRVMLHWPLMVLHGSDSYPTNKLTSSLDRLETLSETNDLPDFLRERISSLKEKLEFAKEKDLWMQPQPGYWDFTGKDSSLDISGAKLSEEVLVVKRGEGGSIIRKLAMKYLTFPENESKVVVDLAKGLLSPPLETFTVEFWIRPDTDGSGPILAGGNWSLDLSGDQIALTGPSERRVISETKVPVDYWAHISLITTGDRVRLYRHGSLVGSAQLEIPLKLTRYLTLGEGFVGNFDELRVNSRAVSKEFLNFDRPINYLLGFPFITWVQDKFSEAELWNFYGGWLVTNLSLKRNNDQYSVLADDLVDVANFLLGEIKGSPPPPDSLSGEVLDPIERLKQLGKSEKLSPDDKSTLDEILSDLVSFFDLR